MRALVSLAALIAVSPCMGAGADAPPADPKTDKADAADQTIDMARQDFQALRTPGAALDAKADLPKFEMPSISYVPFQRGPSASAKAAAESGKPVSPGGARENAKSGDWLVRAMEENAPSDSRGAKERIPAEAVTQPSLDEGPEKSAADREAANPPAKAEAQHADNPLTAYMSQWISPREQRVLLPVAAGPGPAENAAGGNAPAFASGLGETMEGSGMQPLPAVGGLSPQRESQGPAISERLSPNPYLPALEAPLGIASIQTTLMPPPAAGFLLGTDLHLGQEPPPLSISGAGADTRSGIPAFAQPSDDEKYFKQLKKF